MSLSIELDHCAALKKFSFWGYLRQISGDVVLYPRISLELVYPLVYPHKLGACVSALGACVSAHKLRDLAWSSLSSSSSLCLPTQSTYSVESRIEPGCHGSKASHLTIFAPITTLHSAAMAWRCFLGEETSLPGSLSTLGPVFSKVRGIFRARKASCETVTGLFEKLIFSHVFNVRKTRRLLKLDGLELRGVAKIWRELWHPN